MSTAPENERDLLAAEHALGVLDDPQRAEADRLAASDEGFARLVDEWHARFAPLLDEIAPVTPDAGLWDRINDALDGEVGRESNVHKLERRVTAWRTYSAAISAVAAALLLAVALDTTGRAPAPAPEQPQPQPQRQPVLVANVAAEDRSAAFVVSYDPSDRTMLVSPAVASPAPGHDHELWLIPASGTPLSLGLVASTDPHRLPVPESLQGTFRRDATIAISVEPVGGSPTGQPTGPVVATGKLVAV
ncbi:MAG TPA: anti-sigma factor [Allosphingosinicella sp.]|nr:anti-sigma factor [Allosphingosinicella sp.]